MYVYVTTYISNLIFRNGGFSILTGWGGGNSPLGKVVLEVLPQSACNRSYTVTKDDQYWPRINKSLPHLFQDNLLCAAVCSTIKIHLVVHSLLELGGFYLHEIHLHSISVWPHLKRLNR